MNEYQTIISSRGITRLCHFTKSKNLPFILGNGEYASNGIVANNFISDKSYLEKIDKKRLDKHEDFICTSVQYPNIYYFDKAKDRHMENIFNDWVIIMISPDVINETSKFCPVNSAKKPEEYINYGTDAFNGLFESLNPKQTKYFKRTLFHSYNVPTDLQAEVLIYKTISVDNITDIVFSNEEIAKLEKTRLELCGINLGSITVKYSLDLFNKEILVNNILNNTLECIKEFTVE
ncbi:DarT ssDNA thymidine ADP-ribosyltransferase family protein [Macrococcus capreoli]